MKRTKLIASLMIFGLAGLISFSSSQTSQAKGDEILEQISKYKTWTKVSKEPIKVEINLDSLAGG